MHPTVIKRRAIGWIPRTRTPIWMVAVLVDGRTIAQFCSESEADAFIAFRYPNRLGRSHHA